MQTNFTSTPTLINCMDYTRISTNTSMKISGQKQTVMMTKKIASLELRSLYTCILFTLNLQACESATKYLNFAPIKSELIYLYLKVNPM